MSSEPLTDGPNGDKIEALRRYELTNGNRGNRQLLYTEVFAGMHKAQGPATGVGEIRDLMDVPKDKARERLERLEKYDVVERKIISNRIHIWFFKHTQDLDAMHPANYSRMEQFMIDFIKDE